MNYNIFMDTASETFLARFEKDAELRLQVGDVINIDERSINYVVTRITSDSLSFHILTESGVSLLTEDGLFLITEDATDADISLNYFVRIQDTSPDSISMGRDIEGTLNNLASARSQVYGGSRITKTKFRY